MSETLLSYYGDDLTGSTDVMEALSAGGVPTALFIRTPSAAQRARFAEARAIGLAGTSRSESPAWMARHLAPAFEWLRSLDAKICHYKVCSTFDSSPTIGSIGKAIDIGAAIFGGQKTPLVVGAPQLKRYTAFGQLFAAYRGEVYRIDRHPVMSRHPVTPMGEADLRLHLGRQTAKRIGLIDMAALANGSAEAIADRVMAAPDEVVLIDVVDEATQASAGAILWRMHERGATFVVGSSGVEYALLAEWRRLGLIRQGVAFPSPGAADRIAVVSGSCSPTTERQAQHALAHGFGGVALDPRALIRVGGAQSAVAAAVDAGQAVLRSGRSVILYTALGPVSDIGAELEASDGARHEIGRNLGRILRALIEREGLTRAVIAGGDTSSHALHELDIFALTIRQPLPATPGSPLCVAHSDHPSFDGLEIALKGGQVGADDYFSAILEGRG